MYNTAEIARLVRKKLEGTITDQELLLLKQWAKKSSYNADLLRKVDKEEIVLEDVLDWLKLKEDDHWTQRLESKTFSKIHGQGVLNRPKKIRFIVRLLPYVAVVTLIAFVGYFYLSQSSVEKAIVLQDLKPSVNRASVTLSDGRVIELSNEQRGIVLGKELTYQDGSLISRFDEEVFYSVLKTSPGGQYQITLTDGTKVWLNAESKLTYPSRFEGGQRVVEIVGEAYFEVTNRYTSSGEKIPFIVKTPQQEIEVLGTQFNVMAYTNDLFVQTTLVEGAVKVYAEREHLYLKPNEQGVLKDGVLHKRVVDVDYYVAWKKNEFVFQETELRDAMKILGRWYDFDVLYEGEVPITHFYGSISREKGLSEVLRIMETGGLKFRIEKIGPRNRLVVVR